MIKVIDNFIVYFTDKDNFIQEDNVEDMGPYYKLNLEEGNYISIPKKGNIGFSYGLELFDLKDIDGIDVNFEYENISSFEYFFDSDNIEILKVYVDTKKKGIEYKVDEFKTSEIYEEISSIDNIEYVDFSVRFNSKINIEYSEESFIISDYDEDDDLLDSIMYFCRKLEDNYK